MPDSDVPGLTPDSRWYQPLHNAGIEQLKRAMWNRLGVDYTPGSQHMDDTQTWADRARRVNERGQPDILGLQHYQGEFEKKLNEPAPDGGVLQNAPRQASLRMASALGSNYPNPWSDLGKYTPQAPTSRPAPLDPNPLKFWEHPSPTQRIPIREGWMDTPLSQLQHMAGQVIYPSLNRFLPVDPNAPWVSSQRFENTGIQPSGQRILPPNPPDNVLTFSPRAIDKYLR